MRPQIFTPPFFVCTCLMFTLHAFITSAADVQPLEALEPTLTGIFQGQHSAPPDVSSSVLPFSNTARLLYRWPKWSFSVTCESGAEVAADAELVSQETGVVFSGGLPADRIRIVFAQDEGCHFTNHIIWITEWLKDIPSAVLYDEASKCLC